MYSSTNKFPKQKLEISQRGEESGLVEDKRRSGEPKNLSTVDAQYLRAMS